MRAKGVDTYNRQRNGVTEGPSGGGNWGNKERPSRGDPGTPFALPHQPQAMGTPAALCPTHRPTHGRQHRMPPRYVPVLTTGTHEHELIGKQSLPMKSNSDGVVLEEGGPPAQRPGLYTGEEQGQATQGFPAVTGRLLRNSVGPRTVSKMRMK